MPTPNIDALVVPPNSIETEHALLGAVLTNSEAFHLIDPPLSPNDFYGYANRLIYQAIQTLTAEGKPADILTVADFLRNNGQETETGGLEYLNRLTEQFSSAANLGPYAKIIRDRSIKRSLLTALAELESEIVTKKASPAESLLDEVQSRVLKIGVDARKEEGSFQSARAILGEVVESIKNSAQNPEFTFGCSSGIKTLDEQTRGFKPGQLVVVAARPGIGKTALALQTARLTAVGQNKPVAIFALEMTKNEVMKRMIASQSSVEFEAIESGQMTQGQWMALYQAAETLSKAPIYVDSTSQLSLMRIKSKLRQLSAHVGEIGLVIVDYLQLLSSEADETTVETRALQVGEFSRGLKILAKELNAPILLLSQLNRQLESRPSHKPFLSDLRESGAIEQDADMVILMYSLAKFGRETGDPRTIYIDLAKHRNGRVGEFSSIFRGEFQRFEELDNWNLD